MRAALEAYERLLAAQRVNALLPPRDKAEQARSAAQRQQTMRIRRATRSKAPV